MSLALERTQTTSTTRRWGPRASPPGNACYDGSFCRVLTIAPITPRPERCDGNDGDPRGAEAEQAGAIRQRADDENDADHVHKEVSHAGPDAADVPAFALRASARQASGVGASAACARQA